MGFFDKLKPSYNFAKNIKLILEKVGVDTSRNNIISGEKLLLIHDSILDILTGFSRISPDLDMKILQDIKIYLSVDFFRECYIKNPTKGPKEMQYLIYALDDNKLFFSEFSKFDKNQNISYAEQINIFGKLESNILDFTYEVMLYSANIHGLPYNYYDENDKKIVRDVFGF